MKRALAWVGRLAAGFVVLTVLLGFVAWIIHPDEPPAATTSSSGKQPMMVAAQPDRPPSVPVIINMVVGGGMAIVWKNQAAEQRGFDQMMKHQTARQLKHLVIPLEAREVPDGTAAQMTSGTDQGATVVISAGPAAGCTGWVPAWSLTLPKDAGTSP